MKKILVLALAASAAALSAATLFPAAARADTYTQQQAGALGLGAYVGVPFGVSANYNITSMYSTDFALGAQGSNVDVHGDFLVHFNDILPKPPQGLLPVYFGLGLKVEGKADTVFGMRFVAGTSYLLSNYPIEFFAELAPVLRFTPSVGSNLDGGVGVRYYFALSK